MNTQIGNTSGFANNSSIFMRCPRAPSQPLWAFAKPICSRLIRRTFGYRLLGGPTWGRCKLEPIGRHSEQFVFQNSIRTVLCVLDHFSGRNSTGPNWMPRQREPSSRWRASTRAQDARSDTIARHHRRRGDRIAPVSAAAQNVYCWHKAAHDADMPAAYHPE